MKIQILLLKQWVREKLQNETTVVWKVPVIAKEAETEWRRRGSQIFYELLRETLETTMYQIVLEVTAESRNAYKPGNRSSKISRVIADPNGNQVVIHRNHARRATEIISAWWEHAGDEHVKLLEANKEQLLLAVAERTKQANTQLARAEFLTALADGMDETQTVEQAWGKEGAARLYVEMLDENREV